MLLYTKEDVVDHLKNACFTDPQCPGLNENMNERIYFKSRMLIVLLVHVL